MPRSDRFQRMNGVVVSVGSSATHSFSKGVQDWIRLLAGRGVEGDAHCGVTVKHRSRVAQDPTQPNLRQVHLIHTELFEELLPKGYDVQPGQMGENIATRGIRLLELPVGARLRIGDTAVLELTGLRNPCKQIERFKSGLMSAVLERAADGEPILKAGVMSIVVTSGLVQPGDPIAVELPTGPHRKLERV